MDRYEYKIRYEEIRSLIENGEYQLAAEQADTIDWSRVKKVYTLCTISDLYKKVRRYQDAIEVLRLAYERHPDGKDIIYSLCELYIKTGNVVQALAFYKEFTRIAYQDPKRYILQYKIYVAQDVSKEERIEVLEELKRQSYSEKWAYELAYLYHCMGLATKCVSECDELILWFGEGKYVRMAMELKQLHEPLTPEQQYKYDHPDAARAGEYDRAAEEAPVQSAPQAADPSLYDTREFVYGHGAEDPAGSAYREPSYGDAYPEGTEYGEPAYEEPAEDGGQTRVMDPGAVQARLDEEDLQVSDAEEAAALALGHTRVFHKEGEDDFDIQVRTADVSEYSTVNLQKAIAEGLQEVLGEDYADSEDPARTAVTRSLVSSMMDTDSLEDPELEDFSEEDLEEEGAEPLQIPVPEAAPQEPEPVRTEVFFGETGEMHTVVYPMPQTPQEPLSPEAQEAMISQPPEELAEVMTQEADGQLGLVLPETPKITRQITGQMSVLDVMAEWDRMKREDEQRSKDAFHEGVKRDTGEMFTRFEANLLNGVLERMERGEEIEEAPGAPDFASDAVFEETQEAGTGAEGAAYPEEDILPETEAQEEYPEEAAGESLTQEQPEDAWTVYPKAMPEEVSAEEVSAEEASAEEASAEEASASVAEEFTYTVSDIGDYLEDENGAYEEVPEEAEEDAEAGSEEHPEEESAEEAAEEGFDASEEPEGYDGDEMPEEAEEPEGTGDAPESESDEVDAEEPAEDAGEGSTEAAAAAAESPAKKEAQSARRSGEPRELTREERERFGPYIQSKEARRQLAELLDNISMASFTGNVILAGDDGVDTSGLAAQIMKEARAADSNFVGRAAQIRGKDLNAKGIEEALKSLANGGLIIEKAGELNDKSARDLKNYLERDNLGMIVILADRHRAIEKLIRDYPGLCRMFTARMEVRALSDKSLVAFAKHYAEEREYSISEMGMLALHTKIASRQTNDHAVDVMEVRQIVESAIRHVNRKNLTHFFDVLFGKRYDKEDMIILGEKDFA
ncbi:MAG: tetratricopeptide repeat protein [Lachnospiraceae bacterium]|nr:tetratricopeptide repeat protein [Lachnospiraceae bacterium]